MISKGKFVSIINALKEAHDLQNEIDELMRNAKENIENDFMNAAGIMICHEGIVIELLSDMFDDKCETISWWIYDTDYGKSGTEIFDKEGNVLHDLKTAEDLYDYIANC
ncbi:MAG: hypothetical protein IKK84_00325 [Clostridia bacterium]|nr:hypothetical protein [Clostridia bacterium]